MTRRRNEENILEFTPEPGFTIETLAPMIVEQMRALEMDARINLPNGLVIEIEKDCTVREIIKGYKNSIKSQISMRPPSNRNDRAFRPK